jgi:dTDP-glucose 4,6-dehydratase
MPNVVSTIIREDLKSITQSSAEDLRKIVNSQVVLTGASGFIGTWLSLSFLEARREFGGLGSIVLSCRNSRPLQSLLRDAGYTEGYEFVDSDVRTFPEGIIQDRTLLIHAATPARASLNSENPLEMFDIIEQGQRRLLDLCSRKKAVRFLFLSSGAVYGSQPLDLAGFPETWTGAPDISNPTNAYHEGKRVAELMGFMFGKTCSTEFVSARLFAFLAPFLPLDEHFAAGNFIRDAFGGKQISVNSGGGSIRSYQYATDLCINLWALLIRGLPGEAYNVGSDTEVTIKELAKKISNAVSPQVETIIKGIDSPNTVNRYVPQTTKIGLLGGTENQISLDEAISRTVKWLQEQEAK